MCSKTVSIGLDDLNKILERIEKNEYSTFSEFVQKAIKNELIR
jgi:Arc/MetJ-type ribon-helix-helix transcriptional regulator